MIALPDVNTLIAAAWPNHVHHHVARNWLLNESPNGWATCPITQSGFLRISMNPAVVRREVRFVDAVTLLRNYVSSPSHHFWDVIPGPDSWPEWLGERIQGHRQVTDATLLATALHHGGVLVTLDSGVATLLDRDHSHTLQLIHP